LYNALTATGLFNFIYR